MVVEWLFLSSLLLKLFTGSADVPSAMSTEREHKLRKEQTDVRLRRDADETSALPVKSLRKPGLAEWPGQSCWFVCFVIENNKRLLSERYAMVISSVK
ncbi:MAG: hypothetical protein ACREBG_21810 [Pyrinomonadaceae bacterium]